MQDGLRVRDLSSSCQLEHGIKLHAAFYGCRQFVYDTAWVVLLSRHVKPQISLADGNAFVLQRLLRA